MTGLYANFDANRGDDWASISPATMWWVAGTPNSAFSNPTYLLDQHNRVTRENPTPWLKAHGTSTLTELPDTIRYRRRAVKANGDSVLETAWTAQDEMEALKEVDPVTAKMRKRLFAKMAAEGVIERTAGEKKPTTGLAAAELDIMPYPGMRPDHLRIEQQMLFRKEWKVLSPKQRHFIMLGKVVSNTADPMSRMCQECIKDTEECVEKKIVATGNDAIGIAYKDAAMQTTCSKACLPWLDATSTKAVCKCKIDCALDVAPATCTFNAVDNYLSARTSWLIPAKGSLDKRCVGIKQADQIHWKGTAEGTPARMWAQEKAPNFAMTFWWRPVPAESYKDPAIKSLLYKGPIADANNPVVPDVKPLHIQVDATNKDTPELLVTVAGVQGRVPFANCPTLADAKFTFIGVTKRDKSISVWCGGDNKATCEKIMGKTVKTDEVPCVKKVHSFELDANAKYETSTEQAIYVVQPAAKPNEVPQGFMGKFAYTAAADWDPTDAVKLWDDYIPTLASARYVVTRF